MVSKWLAVDGLRWCIFVLGWGRVSEMYPNGGFGDVFLMWASCEVGVCDATKWTRYKLGKDSGRLTAASAFQDTVCSGERG